MYCDPGGGWMLQRRRARVALTEVHWRNRLAAAGYGASHAFDH
jgi:hypothetical protein